MEHTQTYFEPRAAHRQPTMCVIAGMPRDGDMESYSLWVMPSSGATATALAKEIGAQAKLHSSPVFSPHVTLLPDIRRPRQEVIKMTEKLASQLKVRHFLRGGPASEVPKQGYLHHIHLIRAKFFITDPFGVYTGHDPYEQDSAMQAQRQQMHRPYSRTHWCNDKMTSIP